MQLTLKDRVGLAATIMPPAQAETHTTILQGTATILTPLQETALHQEAAAQRIVHHHAAVVVAALAAEDPVAEAVEAHAEAVEAAEEDNIYRSPCYFHKTTWGFYIKLHML
jgi:hypothetical protein